MGYGLLKLGCVSYPAEVALHHHPSFFGFGINVLIKDNRIRTTLL